MTWPRILAKATPESQLEHFGRLAVAMDKSDFRKRHFSVLVGWPPIGVRDASEVQFGHFGWLAVDMKKSHPESSV